MHFKYLQLDHYKIPFIIRCKLQNAELLEMVVAKGPFLFQGKV